MISFALRLDRPVTNTNVDEQIHRYTLALTHPTLELEYEERNHLFIVIHHASIQASRTERYRDNGHKHLHANDDHSEDEHKKR